MEWKRADLHVHTCFSGWRSARVLDAQDCYVRPEAAFAAARARGMGLVCLKDHDTIDGALDFLSRHPEHEPAVIVGEEVEARFAGSETWIHIGVLGVDEALHADLSRLRHDCVELLAELARRGVFFALNHPFQSFRTLAEAERRLAQVLPLFPAVEVANGTSPRSHVAILAAWLGRSARPGTLRVGGSDAHTANGIGAVCTTAPARTKAEYLEALRAGRCAIEGRPRGFASLVRDVYAIIGQYYVRLYGTRRPLTARRLGSLAAGTALLPASLLGVPLALTGLQYARQEWIARRGSWAASGRTARRRSQSPLLES
jgi:predicted metal-dependent phosphoesterase TrpH